MQPIRESKRPLCHEICRMELIDLGSWEWQAVFLISCYLHDAVIVLLMVFIVYRIGVICLFIYYQGNAISLGHCHVCKVGRATVRFESARRECDNTTMHVLI
jgi:hypothetical protein